MPRAARLDTALAAAQAQRPAVEDIWFGYARLHLRAAIATGRATRASAPPPSRPNALAPLRLLASLALDAGDPIAAQALCRRALAHHARDPVCCTFWAAR
jgi:hypothetical protein